MRLVFFCNYLNHHQVAVADALYARLGEGFTFVSTRRSDASEMKGGMDYSGRAYCHCAISSVESRMKAMQWAVEADVVLFGAESQEFAICRAQKNPAGLSFEVGERWLKRGWLNLLSPVLLRWLKNYFQYFRHANFYKLNSSGFAAQDHWRLHTYRNRCFRWGYFVAVVETKGSGRCTNPEPRLLWVGRFVDWKHPEMPLFLSKRLKQLGYVFHLDMIGNGPLLGKIEAMVRQLGLENEVTLLGNKSNQEVLDAMTQHDIFLSTSDQREGWGVVINEALSSRCIVVASNTIGAVPFLINDGKTGIVFESENIDSLVDKIRYILDYPDKMKDLSEAGFETISSQWSPQQAAENLLQLVNDLQQGHKSTICEGPCSFEFIERESRQ